MIAQDLAQTLVDPRAYADGKRIDHAFAWLRREAPLEQAQPEGFDPFWAVVKHADILEVERQNELFHNGDRPTVLTTIEAEDKVRAMTGGSPHLVRSLVQMDNPDHFNYRKLTQGAFLPQNLKALEKRVRELARAAVDRMAEMGGRCDFARDVAFLYPLRVIMSVLGVPKEDEPFMLRLTQELFSSADPELNRDGREVSPAEALMSLKATADELEAYFGEVTRKFRANPSDHVNSLIANATINGDYLNHRQLMGYYIIAATAGHDTTSNTTAGAMWAMAERPGMLEQMQANPDLINAFVEESIRWEVPVKHFMRSAVADCEVGGQQIKAGDWLMLSYQSGNRDESVWADPFEFRMDREQNPQIAFGYGVHVCLGQHLARMEMRILWEELFKRLKSVEMNGKGERTISNFVCGPKHVPIRFTVN